MSCPRLTVCIPVYNSAGFLAAAIESVLEQSFSDFELLILDDGSSDGSRDIVAGYAARDPRIVTRFHQQNLGMVPNWNACLREARGEYIKYLFGDDLLASRDALAKMVALLDGDPAIALVASARNIIDHESKQLKLTSTFPADLVLSGAEVINRCLFRQKNLIGEPSAVMFRKNQARRGYDLRYSQLVDLEMWFHLLEQGKFCYLAEPLACFRIHEDQQTKKNVRNLVHVEEMITLLAEYGSRAYLTIRPLTRRFLLYNQLFRIWKAYQSNLMDRDAALAKITPHCPPRKFLALIPLYKVLSPIWKLAIALVAK